MESIINVVHTVKPAEDTPKGTMLMSDLDQFVPITHTPGVYFYPCPPPPKFILPGNDSPLEILERSLSQALVSFYPLAGRLQWNARGDRLEVNCNSEGAILIGAESDSKLDDFKRDDFCPTPAMSSTVLPSSCLIDYMNKPINEMPLLVVQLTKFSCGGLCLSVNISHILADGMASADFILEWSRIARGGGGHVICLDRTMLRHPRECNDDDDDDYNKPAATVVYDHSLDFHTLPTLIRQLEEEEEEEHKKETTVAMLKITGEQVNKLTENANGGGGLTRYEAIVGHTWRCLCKARQLAPQQQTAFHVAVNIRNRIEPNLPERFFGNAILLVASTATSGELLSNPLSYASTKIRQSIRQVDDQYVRSAIAYLANQEDLSKFRYSHVTGTRGGAFVGNPNANMVSLNSIPAFFGIDFGWGKEIHMGLGSIGADGKSFLLPGRHDDDNNSFLLTIRLQVAHMAAFKDFFYKDLTL